MLVAAGNHVLGAQRTHMQPDGRTARSAVVKEHDGPVLSLRVFLEVCDVKHTCNRGCVFRFLGRGEGKLAAGLWLAVQAKLSILDVGRANGERAGDGRVSDLLPRNCDRALGRNFSGWSLFGGFVGSLVGGGLGGRFVVGTDKSGKNQKGNRQRGGQ